MKYTSEMLMKAMGLAVGDKVKVKNALIDAIYTIDNTNGIRLLDEEGRLYHIISLVDQDIEILPKPKKAGDTYCRMNCETCPLMCVCDSDWSFEGQTLFDVFNYELTTVHNDQEIHDLIKTRLDKEVVEKDE